MTVFKGKLGPEIEEYKDMPNDTIAALNPQPWKVSGRFNQPQLTSDAEAYHSEFGSVAYLVVHKDEILFEKYWEHFDKDVQSNSFSMAKSILGVLTGIAIREGYLNGVDQPVYRVLPQYDEGFGKELTIEHLLTMSSGIDFDEHYLNPFAFPARANYGDNLELLVAGYKVTEKPGEYFDYQSGTTQVLSFALKNALRKSPSSYASEKLWSKIGAEYPAYWSLDHKDGYEKAFCCFNAVARDFARIGKLYLQMGNWNGEQLVDSAYVQASVSPPGTMNSDGSLCEIYGYSWWLGAYKDFDFYFMRGIKGQYVLVIPSKDLIVVRLGRTRDSSGDRDHPNDVYQYIDMALEMIEE